MFTQARARKAFWPLSLGVALCVTLLLFPACAHTPQVANFGFFSIDKQRTRDVACVGAATFNAYECERLSRAAILQINTTLGFTRLRYIGILERGEAQEAYDHGVVVVSGLEKLRGSPTLGMTMPKQDSAGFIVGAIVALNPELLTTYEAMAVSVVVHEYLHVCGIAHAVCEGPFASIMTPAQNCPAMSPHITAGDAETFKQAYPK